MIFFWAVGLEGAPSCHKRTARTHEINVWKSEIAGRIRTRRFKCAAQIGDPSGSRTRVPDVRGRRRTVRQRPNLTKLWDGESAQVRIARPNTTPWLSNGLSKF